MTDYPQAYFEMDERATVDRIIKRITDPEQVAIRKLQKEEKEMNEVQAKRIGL